MSARASSQRRPQSSEPRKSAWRMKIAERASVNAPRCDKIPKTRNILLRSLRVFVRCIQAVLRTKRLRLPSMRAGSTRVVWDAAPPPNSLIGKRSDSQSLRAFGTSTQTMTKSSCKLGTVTSRASGSAAGSKKCWPVGSRRHLQSEPKKQRIEKKRTRNGEPNTKERSCE